jgi:hypothetical protein
MSAVHTVCDPFVGVTGGIRHDESADPQVGRFDAAFDMSSGRALSTRWLSTQLALGRHCRLILILPLNADGVAQILTVSCDPEVARFRSSTFRFCDARRATPLIHEPKAEHDYEGRPWRDAQLNMSVDFCGCIRPRATCVLAGREACR